MPANDRFGTFVPCPAFDTLEGLFSQGDFMKILMKTLLVAAALGTVSLAQTAVPASAQPSGFSFRMGDVGIAYNDGYYDRSNRFHTWRHAREREWYRSNYQRHYFRPMRHDQDRDGIPDRMDRDRDGDGTPNYRDARPNNPSRR